MAFALAIVTVMTPISMSYEDEAMARGFHSNMVTTPMGAISESGVLKSAVASSGVEKLYGASGEVTTSKKGLASTGDRQFVGPMSPIGPQKPSLTKKNEKSDKKDSDSKRASKKNAEQVAEQPKEEPESETVNSENPENQEMTENPVVQEETEPSWPSFWAKHQIMDYHAHDDDSINEWAPGYYVAHSTSPAGQAIHASDVGSVIIIDGTPVTIASRCHIPESDDYESIRASLGSSCVIFQTCDEGGMNLVLTGYADGWGPFETIGGGEQTTTYYNDYGTFSTYEEAEAVRIEMERQEQQAIEQQMIEQQAIEAQSMVCQAIPDDGFANVGVIEGELCASTAIEGSIG